MYELNEGIAEVASFARRQSLPVDARQASRIKIRLADSMAYQTELAAYVGRRYSARGYEPPLVMVSSSPNVITLSAEQVGGVVVASITLGLDGGCGLLCEEAYGDIVAPYRQAGERLCELTRFAMGDGEGAELMMTKYVMAALLHVAYIFGRKIHGTERLFIEVNPRHEAFYKRCLGFTRAGDPRHCARANAPAVLLQLPLDYVDRQLCLHGGKGDDSNVRSLYPFCFSQEEQNGILTRLQKAMGRPS